MDYEEAPTCLGKPARYWYDAFQIAEGLRADAERRLSKLRECRKCNVSWDAPVAACPECGATLRDKVRISVTIPLEVLKDLIAYGRIYTVENVIYGPGRSHAERLREAEKAMWAAQDLSQYRRKRRMTSPRTDAILHQPERISDVLYVNAAYYAVLRDHARQLERELASERRVIEGLAEIYDTTPENLRGVAEGTYS